MRNEPIKARLSVRAAPPPTKREVLAKALEALGAKRITGTEATQIEAALHRGVAPHREILERIFERPLGKSLGGQWQRIVGHRAPFVDGAAATSDQALLDASPSFLSIGDLLKATPASEGGERFIYLEASNETRDLQGEVLLAKALQESADYFLKFGNIDLEHFTILGRPNPRTGFKGFADYADYEIGRPVDVRVDGLATFVKARIAGGTGPYVEKANRFWSSITELDPPKRWFPSVGGAVLAKSIQIDADTGDRYPVINKVRWSNVGMSLNPVNHGLASCSTVPFGVLAKCWGTEGIDMRKSLEAGYGSDSATLTGGSAIRTQSLDAPAKRKLLAQAMAALKAKRITGEEASDLETAVNRGAMPRKEILDRIGRTR